MVNVFVIFWQKILPCDNTTRKAKKLDKLIYYNESMYECKFFVLIFN